METLNITEKEVAKTFQIPLKALKRCRNEKKFGLDICFTPPFSHKILYNKVNFTKWFDDNKLPGLATENQYIRAQLKHLNMECNDLISRGKRIGFYVDRRKKKK
jgi:hypothetical protein